MDTTQTATVTGIIASVLTLMGATGVTVADVQGFLTVIGAIVSLASFVVAHFAHKSAVDAALNTPAPEQQG